MRAPIFLLCLVTTALALTGRGREEKQRHAHTRACSTVEL